MMLGPVLNLVNGPVVDDAIRDPNNRIAKILAAEKDDARVVEELYLAILCRLPTRHEIEAALKAPQGRRGRVRQAAREKRARDRLVAYEKKLPESARPGGRPAAAPRVDRAGTGQARLKRGDADQAERTIRSWPAGTRIRLRKRIPSRPDRHEGHHGIRLEVLPDPSLPAKGPGRSPTATSC